MDFQLSADFSGQREIMRLAMGAIVGVAFGALTVAFPWAQARLGYYFSPLLQPALSIIILIVLGFCSELFVGKKMAAGFAAAWLFMAVLSSSIIVLLYAIARYYFMGESFGMELHVVGLALSLLASFSGFGMARLIKVTIGNYRERWP
jgi:hypothetical protein